MSSERAGTPTHDRLDRDKARDVLEQYGLGYLDHEPAAGVLDALEACVVPDPRITRIEALLAIVSDGAPIARQVREILRGE